jgi:hypothetical protein
VRIGPAEHGDQGVEDLLALPTVETSEGRASHRARPTASRRVGGEGLGQCPTALRSGRVAGASTYWHADSYHA